MVDIEEKKTFQTEVNLYDIDDDEGYTNSDLSADENDDAAEAGQE